MWTMVVLILNAVLYVIALSLSLAVITPLPEEATRRVRVARIALACGGGVTITAAITLTFMGMWFESGLAGCVAIVVVGSCMWFALSQSSSESDDGDDSDDGGGGQKKRPDPPAPPEPLGDEPSDPWSEFDRARAGWEREPAPKREPIST